MRRFLPFRPTLSRPWRKWLNALQSRFLIPPVGMRSLEVVLTRKGQKTRTELLDEFHQPPPEFAALNRADLDGLDCIPAKLRPSGPAGDGAWPGRRRRAASALRRA